MTYWQSLTGRLFKQVFGGYVALAIVVTVFQLTLEYSAIQQNIEKDLASLGQSFSGGVTGAMWELDRQLLNTMAVGIAQSSVVTGVKVTSKNGQMFAASGETPDTSLTGAGALLAPFQFNTTALEKQTATGTRELGQLTIYSDRSVALARVKYSFFVILVNSLIKTAGLWLVFYVIISRSLSKPLSRLTQVVSQMEFAAESNVAIPLDYPHQDELGRLMAAMRKMQQRLVAAHSELERVNLTLEDTVAQRTRHLADALAFNETILMNSPIPVGVYAASGQCVLANDAYAQFVGTAREELLAQNFHAIAAWQTTSLLGDCLTALAHQAPLQREGHVITSAGKEVSFEYRIIPTLLNGGDHLLIQFFDLTAHKRLEEELRHFATHDALTLLPNRRLLVDRLTRAQRVSKRQNSYLAVLFLDLNKFKLLNDTHGHVVGDKLLVEVALRLQRLVRESDTVARLGGDEFVVLLEGLGADRAQAEKYTASVAEKIRVSLGHEYTLGNIRHRGSASIGTTLAIGDDIDAEQILIAADAAMYEVKKTSAP